MPLEEISILRKAPTFPVQHVCTSMIARIEALNYRCLRYVSQPLDGFHVLVGPNASGKTTFLDVVAFMGKVVSDGPEAAVLERTQNFQDLVWGREGKKFELAIEVRIPDEIRAKLRNDQFDLVRYEMSLVLDSAREEVGIDAEQVILKVEKSQILRERDWFPKATSSPDSVLLSSEEPGTQFIITKHPAGSDVFYSEGFQGKEKAGLAFSLGSKRSALGNLLEDESYFPVSTWLKVLLTEGVQQLVLNSQVLRRASRPGQGLLFKSDGSNLPWVIAELRVKAPERFHAWIAHLRTALPDIEDIYTIERPEDRHRYLNVRYKGGLEVPSWMVSDGTLRLLALTLPAYLTDFEGVYLIEEPENGVHPRAVEAMIQSLSSVYNAQILLATHSPVILGVVQARDVLCFAKTSEGATDIIEGTRHPALEDWRGEENLSVLFASGVLG